MLDLKRRAAKLWLSKTIVPLLQGYSEKTGEPPDEVLKRLIRSGWRLRSYLNGSPEEAAQLRETILSNPAYRPILGVVRQLDLSDRAIEEGGLTLLEVLGEIDKKLHRAIALTPGGVDWWINLLKDLRDFIFPEGHEEGG